MTLTDAAGLTKRALRVGGLIFVIFLILWTSFQYYYNNIYLPAERAKIKPDIRFGLLPKIDFPTTKVSSSTLTYRIDTASGFLPTNFPRLGKVYFITQSGASLQSPDKARELSTKLGFNTTAQILSPTLYQFNDNNNGQLTINLDNLNFDFQRPYFADSQNEDTTLPSDKDLAGEFKEYLKEKNILSDGLTSGRMMVVYDQGTFKNSSQALVSIWQNNIEDFPIMTENYNDSLIKAKFTKNSHDETQRIIELNYTYWPIETETFGTYYLKTSAQAFEELKNGQGTVIIAPTSSQTSITKVYLSYFLNKEYSTYLQPIYVFESDEFVAYVPALTAESYNQ